MGGNRLIKGVQCVALGLMASFAALHVSANDGARSGAQRQGQEQSRALASQGDEEILAGCLASSADASAWSAQCREANRRGLLSDRAVAESCAKVSELTRTPWCDEASARRLQEMVRSIRYENPAYRSS